MSITAIEKIGVYTITATSVPYSFGDTVTLTKITQYSDSFLVGLHQYNTSGEVGFSAINQYKTDYWDIFYDTSPFVGIASSSDPSYYEYDGTFTTEPSLYNRNQDWFLWLKNKFRWHYGNYLYDVSIDTINGYVDGDISVTPNNIKIVFEFGYILYNLHSDSTFRHRNKSVYKFKLKEDFQRATIFPPYKVSLYENRIETNCCLQVCCEPTKYILI